MATETRRKPRTNRFAGKSDDLLFKALKGIVCWGFSNRDDEEVLWTLNRVKDIVDAREDRIKQEQLEALEDGELTPPY